MPAEGTGAVRQDINIIEIHCKAAQWRGLVSMIGLIRSVVFSHCPY